jgi:L-Lysine epsilon oxidase N-terminal/L-lysine epsilon oxidase C-terminal domain
MPSTFKIHPSIGIARLGDSPTQFYLSPDEPGVLPIECDPAGKPVIGPDGLEKRVEKFKDAQNRVKRQAARFRVYLYDEANPAGRELKIGDQIEILNQPSGQRIIGLVTDVLWTVYLANKKASWYEFDATDGEHGYAPDHPLRNADIADPALRQHLIIDPGPQTVGLGPKVAHEAEFARGKNLSAPQCFPPPLQPCSIDTLGEVKVYKQDDSSRLIVLGGFGNSGSAKQGLGQPSIQTYANNDGWFDDSSDGPVTAQIAYKPLSVDGKPPLNPAESTVIVGDSAWVIVGYPRYAPQIVDIITMDDLVYDLSVRQFASAPQIFNAAPPAPQNPRTPEELAQWRRFARWNADYRPYFWRDIYPIITRPQYYSYVMDVGSMNGGDPHNATPGANGNLDPNQLSIPPHADENPADARRRAGQRAFIYSILRKPGQENLFTPPDPRSATAKLMLMPYLCGDNPLSNTVPSKFLRLTDTQLFFMKQWAEGKFINERDEKFVLPPPPSGEALDRGALATMLGGAFCPGAEACWIMRNPAIYAKAYRLKVSPDYLPHAARQNFVPGSLSLGSDFAKGLEPGDLTKYGALPWQTDFNECSTQDINLTYTDWNNIYPDSLGDPVVPVIQTTYWWPSHRPMWVNAANGQFYWSKGIPQTNEGDLAMVTAWKTLGFIKGEKAEGNSSFNLVEAQNQ